ncbi:MAG: gliding motility-associated ABC transporter ATP-binding subunit GldA [Cryomorphaceae bacterium BACL22 MAG-120619-bin32]|jgi:ABC-2 type transport system ATP-binding protein|nr:MAG: gliding motility-associated ABC transporter ATP-binding subunit GldA [Cryomorphaceae bacterium BACL22 MAG-120619-bin32]
MSIKVSSVSKVYGSQIAVNDISFEAKNGEIIGFLGPNGAGKSTMMKILTGFLKPDSGEVFVNYIDVLKNPIKAQKTIGYLPENNALYKDMYVREYLHFCASVFKLSMLNNLTVKEQIEICIKKVGLQSESHKKIHQLSKGYQQRVGIAAAILHNPTVLILDEPTTGLDPNQLAEIRTLIKELGKEKTVLFSTHIMQEVEAVCDRVIIVKKGEILVNELLKNLQKNSLQIIEVVFDLNVAKEIINQIPNVISAKKSENQWQITFDTQKDMRSKIFDFAQENNLKILELSSKNKNLETFFREVTVN